MEYAQTPESIELKKKFGEFLQAQRQLRGMSLEEIGTAIRVSTKKLELLEAGEFEKLPPMPFVLGIVKAYGMHLGCDTVELSFKLKEIIGKGSDNRWILEKVGKPHDSELLKVEKPTFYLTSRVIISAVVVIVLLIALWLGFDHFSGRISSYVKNLETKSPPQGEKTSEVTSAATVIGVHVVKVKSSRPNIIKLIPNSKDSKVKTQFINTNQEVQFNDIQATSGRLWALHPEDLILVVDEREIKTSDNVLNLKFE